MPWSPIYCIMLPSRIVVIHQDSGTRLVNGQPVTKPHEMILICPRRFWSRTKSMNSNDTKIIVNLLSCPSWEVRNSTKTSGWPVSLFDGGKISRDGEFGLWSGWSMLNLDETQKSEILPAMGYCLGEYIYYGHWSHIYVKVLALTKVRTCRAKTKWRLHGVSSEHFQGVCAVFPGLATKIIEFHVLPIV